MKLAIGTHAMLLTVELTAELEVASHSLLNMGHHYGITSKSVELDWFYAKNNDNRLDQYLRNEPFEKVGELHFEGDLGAVHQVVYANEGFYITNTDYNSIEYHQPAKGIRQSFHFGGLKTDVNHINSVFPCGNQIWVLLHNKSNGYSEVVLMHHTVESGFRLDRRRSIWHEGCHNLFLDQKHNRLVYNGSHDGKFVSVDMGSQVVNKAHQFKKGHSKGLAVNEQFYFIGVSDYAVRVERHKTKGYLIVIDRASLEIRKRIDLNFSDLPQHVGNVNEIRLLSEADHAEKQAVPAMENVGDLVLCSGLSATKARLLARWKRLKKQLLG